MRALSRDFKGIWIPRHIWLIKDLKPAYRCFLAEIDSLDRGEGCWAYLEHFAAMFSLSKGRCSAIISMLEDEGYIIKSHSVDKQGQMRLNLRLNNLALGCSENETPCLENETPCLENETLIYKDEKYIEILLLLEGQAKKEKLTPEKAVEALTRNTSILESIAMHQKIKIDTVRAAAPVFVNWVLGLGKSYSGMSDLNGHFASWVRKQNLADAGISTEVTWFLEMFNKISRKQYKPTADLRALFNKQLDNGFTGDEMRKAVENLYHPKNKWHKDRGYEHATPEFLLKDNNLNKFLNVNY